MFAGRPIIGISGGIGSGKSYVARLFGELGCLVIDSDAQVSAAYALPEVLEALRRWWGDAVLRPDGDINRRAIAARIFADPDERRRLEGLLHPIVDRLREAAMSAAVAPGAGKPPVAFVWDTPLLFETGRDKRCDYLLFVDAPDAVRQRRVQETRGWDAVELARREKSQWPLDTKRKLSHDLIANTADDDPHGATRLRDDVRSLLSRILAQSARTSPTKGLE